MNFSFCNVCTRPIYVTLPPSPWEREQGIFSPKKIPVPCGKCPECLSKRQKDLSIRCYREALNKGSCYFVTLTYSSDFVPFAQTLLDIDTTSGEVVVDRCPDLCSSEMLRYLRSSYRSFDKKDVYYYYHTLAVLEDHEFQLVYTPTLNYEDVKSKIKLFRTRYEREFGERLDFTYSCVGEYGSHSSRRPHYHILFFGLNRSQVKYFTDLWNLGYTYTECVKYKNEDGSDGLAKVASYIGKYSAKGVYNPSSVLQHLTLPCRISSSRGLGTSSLDKLKSYYCCFDLFGRYNINSKKFIESNRCKLLECVYNRLKYNFNGVEVSLPLSLRRKIFSYKIVEGVACWSRLYYEVMAYARSRIEDLHTAEFKQFCDLHKDKPYSQICHDFENLREADLLSRESSEKEFMRKFYSRSKF